MQCRETIPNYSSFVAEAVSSYVFQIGSKKAAIDRNSISRLIDVLNPPTRRSLQEEEEEMIAMDVDTFRTMIQEQKDVLYYKNKILVWQHYVKRFILYLSFNNRINRINRIPCDGDDTNFGECVKIQYIIQYKIHLRYEVVCNKNIIFIYLR
jgi:hypothetical protein